MAEKVLIDGPIFRKIREKCHKQESLALAAKCSVKTIRRAEEGSYILRTIAIRLAEALDVSLDKFSKVPATSRSSRIELSKNTRIEISKNNSWIMTGDMLEAGGNYRDGAKFGFCIVFDFVAPADGYVLAVECVLFRRRMQIQLCEGKTLEDYPPEDWEKLPTCEARDHILNLTPGVLRSREATHYWIDGPAVVIDDSETMLDADCKSLRRGYRLIKSERARFKYSRFCFCKPGENPSYYQYDATVECKLRFHADGENSPNDDQIMITFGEGGFPKYQIYLEGEQEIKGCFN